jgi:hypothetical protein
MMVLRLELKGSGCEGEERRRLTALLTDQRQPQQPKPAEASQPRKPAPKGLRGFELKPQCEKIEELLRSTP